MHEIESREDKWFLENYVVLKVNFEFPEGTKFPSIPVSLGGTSMVYPLTGTDAIITGPEYLLAKSQKCKFYFLTGVVTPWKKSSEGEEGGDFDKPFFNVINKVQSERRKHKKGTLQNML
jgi:hypothetical protein